MAQMPDPFPSLLARIKRIEDRLNQRLASSPFFGTGVHPNGQQGLDSDNFVTDVSGFRLAETPEFNDLKLRGGIIGNDALTNPVVPDSVWESATGFSVGVAWGTVITKTVTVPAGFTKLVATGKARVTAFYNQGTGTDVDYLYAVLFVGGLSSDYYPLAVTGAGGSGTNHVFRDVVLTGLTPGSTVTFVVQASTAFNTWASPLTNNEARLGASLQWFR